MGRGTHSAGGALLQQGAGAAPTRAVPPLHAGAVDAAARALLVAAGRPEACSWDNATEYEREGWRVAAREVLYAYAAAGGTLATRRKAR
jgi:hypothetical protein